MQTLTPDNLNRVYFPYLTSNSGYYGSEQLLSCYPELLDPIHLIEKQVPLIKIKGDIHQKNLPTHQAKPKLYVDNAIAAADAIVNGVGVSWNYQVVMQKHIDDGEVFKLFEDSNRSLAHAYLSYPSNKRLSKEEETFVNFVLQKADSSVYQPA